MKYIHLIYLKVFGEKGTSIIDFGTNLTVIAGPSNTGKSYIYKSIKFLFGGEAPFKKNVGYDAFELLIDTGNGTIKLTREIGSNKIHIESSNLEITSGDYFTARKDSDLVVSVNDVLLAIIGISKNIKIPKSKDGIMIAFTWNMLMQLFMYDEDHMDRESSILIGKSYATATSVIAAIDYLISQRNFDEFSKENTEREQKKIVAALANFIDEKQTKFKTESEKIKTLFENNEINDETTQNLKEELLTEFNLISTKLSNSISLIQEKSIKLSTLNEEELKLGIEIEQFKELASQYQSDIARLSLIYESNKLVGTKARKTHCEFCHSEIEIKPNENLKEATEAELKNTSINLNELQKTIETLENNRSNLSKEIAKLENEKKKIENTINSDLKPQQSEISAKLDLLTNASLYLKYKQINKTLSEDKDTIINNSSKASSKFRPKELLPDNFYTEIANNFLKIAKSSNYAPSNTASFDKKSFDIVFNNEEKKENGKGYRALFNSFLVFAFKDYLSKHAKLNPHFYFLDSPLKGLSLRDKDKANDENNVRLGLFSYLAKYNDGNQIIIIENTDDHELCDIAADGEKIKIVKFTQEIGNGRYGFLDGIYREKSND